QEVLADCAPLSHVFSDPVGLCQREIVTQNLVHSTTHPPSPLALPSTRPPASHTNPHRGQGAEEHQQWKLRLVDSGSDAPVFHSS
ncbi:Target of rapamycin complex 2 subunit MAPKAP1, partial [Dissostichus eleginoides]